MSKMIFAEAKEPKLEKVLASKPLTTNHNVLMITIAVTMAFSLLIGVGFAYIDIVQDIIQFPMPLVKITF